MHLPAVVVSSHITGLAIIRALGTQKVQIIALYYQNRDMGYVSKYVKKAYAIPHPEKEEAHFLNALIRHARKEGPALLVPADDVPLLTISKNKELLSTFYIVACTDWEITQKFMNKEHTYRLAEKAGIPIPKTIFPKNIGQLYDYHNRIQYPCIVKPCYSHRYFDLFRRKLVRAENFKQMLAAYEQARNAGLDVVIQEHIPGGDERGANYNSYFWDNKPAVEHTAEKVRLSPPRFGIPSVVMSQHNEQVLNMGRKIIRAMGYYGFSCTEFKLDKRDNLYKLMEVNGRHNRSALLAVHCGVNFPWIEYKHLVSGKIDTNNHYKENVYWIDEFRDVFHSLKHLTYEKCSLKQLAVPYFKDHIFATFDINDPKPFVKRCFDLLKMVSAVPKNNENFVVTSNQSNKRICGEKGIY